MNKRLIVAGALVVLTAGIAGLTEQGCFSRETTPRRELGPGGLGSVGAGGVGGCEVIGSVGNGGAVSSVNRAGGPIGGQAGKALLTQAVKIGNPLLADFPSLSPEHNYARNSWDLQLYNDRIYLGCGDYTDQTGQIGPVNIWSFDDTETFAVDTTVDEQQVARFHVYDNKLYVPGIDATESWDFGNLYINELGTWTKLRTIPQGVHVWDVALFEGKLYATAHGNGESLHVSSDGGQSWSQVAHLPWSANTQFQHLVPLPGFLLVTGYCSAGCLWQCEGPAELEQFSATTVPHRDYAKTVRFKDAALWTSRSSAFYRLKNPAAGPEAIRPTADVFPFEDGWVNDIIVRGETAYVLLSRNYTVGKTWSPRGYILASTDFLGWTKLADFPIPCVPWSLERLNGRFYVGLWGKGDPGCEQSGSIWRLESSSPAE